MSALSGCMSRGERRQCRSRCRLDGSEPFKSLSPLSDGADMVDRLQDVPLEKFKARQLRLKVICSSGSEDKIEDKRSRGVEGL